MSSRSSSSNSLSDVDGLETTTSRSGQCAAADPRSLAGLISSCIAPWLRQEDVWEIAKAIPHLNKEFITPPLIFGLDRDWRPIVEWIGVARHITGFIPQSLLSPILEISQRTLKSAVLTIRSDLCCYSEHYASSPHNELQMLELQLRLRFPQVWQGSSRLVLSQLKHLSISFFEGLSSAEEQPMNAVECLAQILRKSTSSQSGTRAWRDVVPKLQRLALQDRNITRLYDLSSLQALTDLLSHSQSLKHLRLSLGVTPDLSGSQAVTPYESLFERMAESAVLRRFDLLDAASPTVRTMRYLRRLRNLKDVYVRECSLDALYDFFGAPVSSEAEAASLRDAASDTSRETSLVGTDPIGAQQSDIAAPIPASVTPTTGFKFRVHTLTMELPLALATQTRIVLKNAVSVGPSLRIRFIPVSAESAATIDAGVQSVDLVFPRINRLTLVQFCPRRYPNHITYFHRIRLPAFGSGTSTPEAGYASPLITAPGAWAPRNRLSASARALDLLPLVTITAVGQIEASAVAQAFASHPDFSRRRFALRIIDPLGPPFTCGITMLAEEFDRFCRQRDFVLSRQLMRRPCEGCGADASLGCPECAKEGVHAFFCSQACFRANWARHKATHGKRIPSRRPTSHLDEVSRQASQRVDEILAKGAQLRASISQERRSPLREGGNCAGLIYPGVSDNEVFQTPTAAEQTGTTDARQIRLHSILHSSAPIADQIDGAASPSPLPLDMTSSTGEAVAALAARGRNLSSPSGSQTLTWEGAIPPSLASFDNTYSRRIRQFVRKCRRCRRNCSSRYFGGRRLLLISVLLALALLFSVINVLWSHLPSPSQEAVVPSS